MKLEERRMPKREEVEHLLKRSREFLETARMQVERGFYGLAVFSLEQVLQLFLRAKLLESGVDYPRTHSLRRLLEMLAEASPDVSQEARGALRAFILELGMLEDAHITSRYILREYRREDAERLMTVVEEVMRAVS